MFSKKKKEEELFSEMRKDAVSGEWILVASGRAKRPHAFRRKGEKTSPMDDCPLRRTHQWFHAVVVVSASI